MSKQIEEWRPVVGYEGLYEVSDWGRVRSVDHIVYKRNNFNNKITPSRYKGRLLKLVTNIYGYRVVSLHSQELGQKEGKVHQLVGKAFIPNPMNKPIIDHIIPIRNGGTDEVWNLRWATNEENLNNPHSKANMRNIQNGRQLNRPDVSKKVYQYLEDEFIAEYPSVREAERQLNTCLGSVSGAVRKGHKINGYNFYYNRMETNMHTWTNEDIELVKKFIEVRNRGLYCSGQEVTNAHNRILHTNLSSTQCASCIRARINTLENALKEFEKTIIKAQETQNSTSVDNVSTNDEKTSQSENVSVNKPKRRGRKKE